MYTVICLCLSVSVYSTYIAIKTLFEVWHCQSLAIYLQMQKTVISTFINQCQFKVASATYVQPTRFKKFSKLAAKV